MSEEHRYKDTADAVGHALDRFDQLLHETEELEEYLAAEERKCGITPDRSKPITERMAAFGATDETIGSVAEKLQAIALRLSR